MNRNLNKTTAAETENSESETSAPAEGASGERRASVTRSAGIVSVAVMFSRVLGLVRETIFARYFGAGFLYDAFLVGFRIPNLLRDLFAEGALSAAFVKVFTDYQIKNSESEAWRLASLVFNGLAVVLSAVTILGIVFSPAIVNIITYNYLGSPDHFYPAEKAALAVTLMQIMFPFILLVALAALAMGVLNTKGRFGIPASASTAFNIASIIFGLGFAFWLSGGDWERSTDTLVVPSDAAQWAIIGMSIGTLIGGGAQFAIQVPSLLKVGFRFSPRLSFRDEGVRRVMRLMAPAIIGTSAVQVKVVVDTIVASGIDGGVSWLSYSFRLMQFPIGVFGVAIGTAAIPTLSRLVAEEKISEFRATLSGAIKLVFLLAVPSACGLIVLGGPIISLIYERGEFTVFDTDMTAWALAAYSVGLAGYAAIKVLSPSFYALDDARTPMYVSLGSIFIHVPLSFGLMTLFSGFGVTTERVSGYGHVGVALATSIVSLFSFLALSLLMRRKIKRFDGRDILLTFLKIAAASAIMSLAAYGSYHLLAGQFAVGGFFAKAIGVLAPIFIGGIVFLAAAKLLRIDELEKLIGALRRKM